MHFIFKKETLSIYGCAEELEHICEHIYIHMHVPGPRTLSSHIPKHRFAREKIRIRQRKMYAAGEIKFDI